MRTTLDNLLRRHPEMSDADADWMLATLRSHLEEVTSKDPTPWSNEINRETTEAAFSEMESLHAR